MGMKVEKVDDPTRTVLEELDVVCAVKLTEDELLDRGRRLAECHSRIDDADAALNEAKADHKAAVTPIMTEIDTLAATIRRGTEDRSVTCDLVINEPMTRVETVRRDTGEIVRVRPLTEEERQRELFRRQRH